MRRIPPTRRALIVDSARSLSPSVRELVLRTEDRSPIDFLAGQWFKLYLPGGIDRDYSSATAPDPERPDRFAIAVTRVDQGPGSAALHDAQIGDRIESNGPNGLFVREESHRAAAAIYVGTGTGLAPLRAMLTEELERDDAVTSQVLIFGCRTERDLLWRDELAALAARHPRFHFVPTLSKPEAGWHGRRGWVQSHLKEIVPPYLPAHLYVCGLTKMITDVRRVLKEELGIDRRWVHSERYD
jgi:NAD(P)H-flavin reductase